MIIKRITLLIVAVSLIFLCGQTMATNAITISKIDGLDSTTGGLMANTPIRFYVHFQVGEFAVIGMVNGFRVYSPDGADWQPLVPRELVMCSSIFDFLCGFFYGSVDGMGADTVAVFGTRVVGSGLDPGFNSDYFLIETSLTEEQIGRTLCLDSSFLWPNPWTWVVTGNIAENPTWDGPHCFEIVDCCSGNRGDVNGDGVGPNILDLTRLVDFVFRGAPAPDCQLESDVNGDGTPYNIIDLTFVVDFVFRGGPPAPACPN